jgi:hypothetical protein
MKPCCCLPCNTCYVSAAPAGAAPLIMPAPGVQQYAAPPYHQWVQGTGGAMRMMPGSSATAGYVYSQPGP